MIKTIGFGLGALAGPAMMTGAILYTSAPEAATTRTEHAAFEEQESTLGGGQAKAYKDYGVVWSKLYRGPAIQTL